MHRHEAVVSGIGVVSPLGSTITDVTERLRTGQGATPSPLTYGSDTFAVLRACGVAHPQGDASLVYGMHATRHALVDAALEMTTIDPRRLGVVAAASKGGLATLEHYEQAIQASQANGTATDAINLLAPSGLSQEIAALVGARGPVKGVVTACATGTHAIIEGVHMVEDGVVDVCIAGASDASIDPLMLAGYRKLGVYARECIRPYDRRRDGFLVGEGAGIVVLERYDAARARGARCYGTIDACVMGQETGDPLMYNEADGALSECFRRFRQRIGAEPIDYMNTHGTATEAGDRYETQQIKKAFGPEASGLALSSTKSFMGHLLGASGAVECIICLLAMAHGFVPPTIHCDEPDPACDLDYTTHGAVHKTIHRAVSFSLGFGGHIGIIGMKKVEER